MCISRPTNRADQRLVYDLFSDEQTKVFKTKCGNLPPTGDPMVARSERDGIIRIGNHNIRGTALGRGEPLEEIEAIAELGFDVKGMNEINKPWTAGNKWRYDEEMEKAVGPHHTIYASAEAGHNVKHQPGGTLLTVNGDTARRHKAGNGDRMGRLCWMTLQGERDEGVLILSAYRVVHEKSDNPGPNTAYAREYSTLRSEGMKDPRPRAEVLKEIKG